MTNSTLLTTVIAYVVDLTLKSLALGCKNFNIGKLLLQYCF